MRPTPEARQPAGQCVGMMGQIVHAADARVFEGNSPALPVGVCPGRVEDGRQGIATIQRYELFPQQVVGGMQRDGQRHRKLEVGESFDARHDSDRRDRDVARRDAEVVVKPCARVEHGLDVGEGLAHSHEHDVRDALRRRVLRARDLLDDLARRELTLEPGLTGRTERAAHRAPGLRRYTDGRAPSTA